ncbi:hypothetical protein [Methylocystis heyeri]|uniref:Uncharacterized protein n=1 Tax=Methylocystis heyeri TaxID=391905 RepID=A0A6B8KEN5_9HYPH|nr:hypothetical protein [Methylocystis heyeri]QGM46147.1 hypothetical protein H2LOC_010815 [Methylocystis heyeri]
MPSSIPDRDEIETLRGEIYERALVIFHRLMPELSGEEIYNYVIPSSDRANVELSRRMFPNTELPHAVFFTTQAGAIATIRLDPKLYAVPMGYAMINADDSIERQRLWDSLPAAAEWLRGVNATAVLCESWVYAIEAVAQRANNPIEVLSAMPSLSLLLPESPKLATIRAGTRAYVELSHIERLSVRFNRARRAPANNKRGWGKTISEIDRDAATMIAQSAILKDTPIKKPSNGVAGVYIATLDMRVSNPFITEQSPIGA